MKKVILPLLMFTITMMSMNVRADEKVSLNENSLIVTNPLNLSYRFDYGDPCHRTAADPVIVLYHDVYFLFSSHASGYWYSSNLKDWTHVATKTLEVVEEWAPAVMVYEDAIYYIGFGNPRLFRSTDPINDKWEEVKGSELPGTGDPAFFVDNDNRVYFLYGCSSGGPMKGFEVDPHNNFKRLTPEVDIMPYNGDRLGWEIPGDHNEKVDQKGWNEGVCMVHQGDYYYFFYATPGTEYTSYCSGVYVSRSPLGPFTPMDGAPFAIKPDGFITGGGHGHPFVDRYGNTWYVATLIIGEREHYERRIGIFPAYYTSDGYAHAVMDNMDLPFVLPEEKVDFSKTSLLLDMNLISPGKRMIASSTLNSNMGPEKASDDNVKTWWAASSGRSGEWIRMDLGRPMSVEAVQVCFADQGFKTYRKDTNVPIYRYVVQGSMDGTNWQMLMDRSKNSKDQIYELGVLPEPTTVRYIRVTNRTTFTVGQFSVTDLRVFGHADGEVPAKVTKVTPVREESDYRRIRLSWNESNGAIGYIIRWGTTPERMTHAARVYTTNVNYGFFDRDATYYFAIQPFNEAGMGPMSETYRLPGSIDAHLSTDADGFYNIAKPEDLQWFAGLVGSSLRCAGSNARIANDISMSGSNFQGLGSEVIPFYGEIDGGGHTISNLVINNSNGKGVGLVGVATTGLKIHDLTLTSSCQFQGNSYVGGFVGRIDGNAGNVWLQHLGFEGIINTIDIGGGIVGGAVSDQMKGNLLTCYSMGTVLGTRNCGALAGWLSQAQVENCYTKVWGRGYDRVDNVVRGNDVQFVNCYGNRHKQAGLTEFTDEQMTDGTLLNWLADDAYVQNIGTDNHPMLLGSSTPSAIMLNHTDNQSQQIFYDLQGRRVTRLGKGVYVTPGQKPFLVTD